MASNFLNKIKTDQPLLDEIIYNAKIMAYGTVLKDEDEALSYETLETIQESDRYIAAYEGRYRIDTITYDAELLRSCYLVPQIDLLGYIADPSTIPTVLKNRIAVWLNNKRLADYEEKNNYYRRLNGKPDLNEIGIKLSDLDIPDTVAIRSNIIYLHECDVDEINTLDSYGIIERVISDNPSKKYLNYLGPKSISVYAARKAFKFAPLYVPTPPALETYNRFTELLEVNRVFVMKTVYQESQKFMSDYYDKFIIIMILIQTMIDMVIELPEYIIRKDIFDLRTIEYIFEANGMPFYQEIPIKYQIRLVQNLNRLKKYGGSNKCIVDICSLFGFDNIEIFKYYILRDRNVGDDGNYTFNKKEDPLNPGTYIDDDEKNYTLKFIKVPIDGIADDYIRDPANTLHYDDVTTSDKYWDGDYSHEYVKKKIVEKEFGLEITKYISIDTIYELTDLSFEMPYFINMIMFDDTLKDKLNIHISSVNDTLLFNLVDAFIYLYALGYIYRGVEDKIFDSSLKVMAVKGFNFDVDMTALQQYLIDHNTSLTELGINFMKPGANGIITSKQLLEIFLNNKKVYNFLVKSMNDANNIREYEIFKKIYESLMITELNYDYYQPPTDPVERANYTYTAFLEKKSPLLYQSLATIKSIPNTEVRNQRVTNEINVVTSAITEFLETNELENIFSNLPTVSADYVKIYMFKIINFFKSYQVQMLNINTIYKFDDALDNKITMIDDVWLTYVYTKIDNMVMRDSVKSTSVYNPNDSINIKEKYWMETHWWRNLNINDKMEIIERIASMLVTLFEKDKVNILEELITIIQTDKETSLEYHEVIASMLVTVAYMQDIPITDDIDITSFYTRLYNELYQQTDYVDITTVLYRDDNVNIVSEFIYRTYVLSKNLNINIYDAIFDEKVKITTKDSIDYSDNIYIDYNYNQ